MENSWGGSWPAAAPAVSTLCLLLCGLSCSSETPASNAHGGSASGAAGSGATGGSSIGGSSSGGSSNGGSPQWTAPTAPLGGVGGGGTAGAAGVAGSSGNGGNDGGGGGTGGLAGSVGVGGGGGAGGGGLSAIAGAFDKFRLECPCIDADHFGADKTDNCDATPAVDRQTYMKAVAGDATVVYDVKLHVRGNTEPNTYVKGALDANKRFYVGGETSTPGYTAYMLTVSEPPQVYFLNYNASTSHIHFLIDYEVTIPMRGGTTVKFEVNGGKSTPDGHGVSNREQLVVPDVPPAPAPFNGQFVQFDVVSVQARP